MSNESPHTHEAATSTDDRNEENDQKSTSSFLTTSNTSETINDKTTEANVSTSPCSTYEVDMGLESTVQALTNTEELDSADDTPGNLEDRNITKNTPQLSHVESIMVAAVLRDCNDQLNILGFTNPKPQRDVETDYVSLEDRFSGGTGGHKRGDAVEQGQEREQRLDKIQVDRWVCETVLRRTRDDLLKNRTFHCLTSFVRQEANVLLEEETLLREVGKNTALVEYLRKQLKKEKAEGEEEVHRCEQRIAELKDQLWERTTKSETELKYVEKWEQARKEQASLRLSKQEEKLRGTVEENRFSFEVETRVSAEIEAYIQQSQAMLETQIEEWTTKYDADTVSRDKDLNCLRQERAAHTKEYEALALLYRQRQDEMTEYLSARAEKERLAAHELYVFNAATKIEAWWRGVMVRRHLGPYRKKKKDKKGGKEKRGGKK